MFIRLRKMTAEELLERYAQGELDFSGAHSDGSSLARGPARVYTDWAGRQRPTTT
jgi:hypothetical protein